MKELILKAKDLAGRTSSSNLGFDVPFNFELYSGEVGIIFSENQSSEMGRLLFGQGKIHKGSLEYHQDIEYREGTTNWKKNIGFSFRDKGLISNLSIFENVNLPTSYYNYDKSNTIEALEDVEIDKSLWNKRPHEVNQSILKLTLLARSIVLKPKFLFLDDPSALLSPRGRKEFYHWLKKQREKGTAILISTNEIYHASIWGDWYLCPKEHIRKNDFHEILTPEQISIQSVLMDQMQKKDFFDELLPS